MGMGLGGWGWGKGGVGDGVKGWGGDGDGVRGVVTENLPQTALNEKVCFPKRGQHNGNIIT